MLLFCLPVVAGNVFQMLYGAADAVAVGRLAGLDRLAAVGLDVPPVTELMHEIRGAGVPVRADILSVPEAAEELYRYLAGKTAGEGGAPC